MKVAKCMWCDGKGKTTEMDPKGAIGPGTLITYKTEHCERCEGSGVIAYKPVKEVPNED